METDIKLNSDDEVKCSSWRRTLWWVSLERPHPAHLPVEVNDCRWSVEMTSDI